MIKIHSSFALKLHAYGLNCLHDPNWTGMVLYDKLKQHLRGGIKPFDILHKTIPKGLLFHLGLWFFEEYVLDEYHFENLDDEYKVWFLEDLYEVLICMGANENDPEMAKLKKIIDEIENLYEENEEKYFEFLKSEEGFFKLFSIYQSVIEKYKLKLLKAAQQYAADYADRVFHDRQLCEYISKTIVLIGFDGIDSPKVTEPKQWIQRKRWPEWAKKAIRARDRGKCSECGADMVSELEEEESIDHIVPLAKGGSNDISNLQLLCFSCNRKKSISLYEVKSSIPAYIQRQINRKI